MAVAAVASKPLQADDGGSFTSMFYALDARGDIIVSNSSTRFLKNIKMGIQPQRQQYITVVGCATKGNVFHPIEADMEAVSTVHRRDEEKKSNHCTPCADEWKGFDLLSDCDTPRYNSSVECGTIFEKNFSPEGIFWKGSPSGLMTVSSGKVDDNGPINVIWTTKEDDDIGRGCTEAKIYFEPSDGAMTLFEVAFLIGRHERVMRISVLGDKETRVEDDGVKDDGVDYDSSRDNRDPVIVALASILGIIGFVALLFLIKDHIYMLLVYIVAHTCARRYPI